MFYPLKIFKKYFYFEGNILYSQITDKRTHSPVAINLPKYSPDIGFQKNIVSKIPPGGANVFLALSLNSLSNLNNLVCLETVTLLLIYLKWSCLSSTFSEASTNGGHNNIHCMFNDWYCFSVQFWTNDTNRLYMYLLEARLTNIVGYFKYVLVCSISPQPCLYIY